MRNKMLLFMTCFLVLVACKKEKLDVSYRSDTEVKGLSAYRFINLGDYTDIRANGDSLTNFWAPLDLSAAPSKYYQFPGTSFFPKNGKFEKEWKLPNEVFRANGRADLFIEGLAVDGSKDKILGLTIRNEGKPKDYYLLNPTLFDQPYVAIDRSDAAAPAADHFKIRVINLSVPVNSEGNVNGPMENLAGPVSLAYADGTLVSQKTNGITREQMVSEYVELPYGAYQFKLLTADGRQLPGTDGVVYGHTRLDPPSSTLPRTQSDISNIGFAPIKTYQPGGIYTLVVTPFSFLIIANSFGATEIQLQNAFRVIEDKVPAVNTTFSQFQSFNALPGEIVSFRLNGTTFTDRLPYGQSTDNKTQNAGAYKIEALDERGAVLASLDYTLNARQSYTAWVYPGPGNKAKLVVEVNDLSGTVFKGGSQEDASYDYNQYAMPFAKRFLNLCPDVPYVSFTADDGQSMAGTFLQDSAVYNLQPGEVPSASPYAWSLYSSYDFKIMSYRSEPEVIPGIWAADIPMLSGQDFIARNALYTGAARELPAQEPGFFTVALIGRTGQNIPEERKAKMVILKHNK